MALHSQLDDDKISQLAPKLATILFNEDQKQSVNILAAQDYVEQHYISHASNDAERYMGCLIKAYLRTVFYSNADPKQEFAQRMDTFTQGQAEITARSGNYRYDKPRQYFAPNQDTPLIVGNSANLLAFWKICEHELARHFSDPTLAKRLANSTAMLTTLPTRQYQANTDSHEQYFVEELKSHGLNPFQNAKIFEFGAHKSALSNPLISLFAQYKDYSPVDQPIGNIKNSGYVTLATPGEYFKASQNWAEEEKFDYVIAANIFCFGASTDPIRPEKVNGDQLVVEVLPHLTHLLKNNGQLLVCNTAHDAYDLDCAACDKGVELSTLGIEQIGERIPTYLTEDGLETGLSIFIRSHTLREGIPIKPEEFQHKPSLMLKNAQTIRSKTRDAPSQSPSHKTF